jgi:hypothetical protein
MLGILSLDCTQFVNKLASVQVGREMDPTCIWYTNALNLHGICRLEKYSVTGEQ